MSCNQIIHKLLIPLNPPQNLLENKNYSEVTSKFDWLIMPILNPDGYHYSHEVNRKWRKNRDKGSGQCQDRKGSEDGPGVDLNR